MHSILLPTDFSKNSQNAIDYAIYLFEREQCTFYILHAYYLVPSETGTKFDASIELDALHKRLEATKSAKHTFETILVSDTALGAIDRAIFEKDIQFVFMGTTGFSAVQDVFMGSVTTSVLKNINSSTIIAVPGEYDYDIPDDILFANDYKHTFKPAELSPIIKIASLWGSIINIVYVNSKKKLENEQESNKELLDLYLKKTKHRFIKVKKKSSVTATLKDLEKDYKNIGMVVFLKTEHSFFKKLIREPIIRNMTFKTEVPLMIMPVIK